MTHAYFVEKARTEMKRAGGDPDLAGPLAEWAEAAKAREEIVGVIVGEDGVIVGEAMRGSRLNATPYVTVATRDRWGLRQAVVDLSVAELDKLRGVRHVYLQRWRLCDGAGR